MYNKKKKAFTLIELLAVIIILAVIALIATPIVLRVVNDAREEARKDSVIGYADAVRLSYIETEFKPSNEALETLANNRMQGDEVKCNIVKYNTELYGTMLYGCNVEGKGNYCYFNGRVYEDGSLECNSVHGIITTDRVEYNAPIISVVSQTPDNTSYGQSKNIKIEFPSLAIVTEHYYVRTSNDTALSNAIATCGTGTEPGACSNIALLSLSNDGTWYEVSGTTEFEINENIVIEAAIGNNGSYTLARYEESFMDTTKPEVDLNLSSKTDRIIVTPLCNDTESGITKYEYKLDGNYIEGTSSGYIFEGLENKKEYEVTVKCTNGSGLTDEASSKIETQDIINPTIEQYSQKPENSEYVQERVIRITFNGENVESPVYQYSLDGNDWKTVTTETYDVTFTNDGYLYARTLDPKGNIANASTYTVDNVDISVPKAEILSISIKTDRATIIASCSDDYSGITKYEFSSDGGSTWTTYTSTETSYSHTFINLIQTKDYTFKVRCTNGSGLTEIDSETKTTETIINPTIEQYSQKPENSQYVQERVIRITFNGTNIESPVYQYSTDGSNWSTSTSTTKDITFTSNGYLYARTLDPKGNIATASTYTIENIDTSKPIPNITSIDLKTDRATVTASCSDLESGITKYEFSSDNGTNWINNGTTNSYTFTNLDQTKSYTFVVRCTNGSGLTDTASKTETTKTIVNPTITQYSQTPSGTYAQSRVIRITFNGTNVESPVYQYSTDGSNWSTSTSTTKDVTFTSNGYLYARTLDPKGNIANASTYSVENVDSTEPTASISSVSTTAVTATVTGSCSDTGSTITKTEYSKDGTNWQTSNTFSGLSSATSYTFRIRCTNGSGMTSTASKAATTATVSLSLGSTSGTVTVGSTTTVTINATNNGTLTCSTSSSSKATCSISGKTLTIRGVAAGSATITVKESYANKSATYSVTVKAAYTCPSGSTLTYDTSKGSSSNDYYVCVKNASTSSCSGYKYSCRYYDAVENGTTTVCGGTEQCQSYANSTEQDCYDLLDSWESGEGIEWEMTSADIYAPNECDGTGWCNGPSWLLYACWYDCWEDTDYSWSLDYSYCSNSNESISDDYSNGYDIDCSSVTYSCPSGWSTYSGSGSSMKCYKAPTKG